MAAVLAPGQRVDPCEQAARIVQRLIAALREVLRRRAVTGLDLPDQRARVADPLSWLLTLRVTFGNITTTACVRGRS
jgi:hypothetical protein